MYVAEVVQAGACCFFDQQLTDDQDGEEGDEEAAQAAVKRGTGFAGRSCRRSRTC